MEDTDFRNDGNRPTIEQAGFIIRHVLDHLHEGGTYRYLIYNRLGYNMDSYVPLMAAGGLELSNLAPVREKEESARILGFRTGGIIAEIVDTDTIKVKLGTETVTGTWKWAKRKPACGELVLWVAKAGPGYLVHEVYPATEYVTFNSFDENG